MPPAKTRSQLRAVLSAGDTEIDATLLIKTQRPDHLRVLGLSDLGATLFHLNRTAAGTEVIDGSPFLSDEFLSTRLAEGLASVFLGVEADGLQLVSTGPGAEALHGPFGREGEVLLGRDGPAGVPARYDLGRDGRLEVSVHVQEWELDTNGRAHFPIRLTLEDARGKARLLIQVLDWRTEE